MEDCLNEFCKEEVIEGVECQKCSIKAFLQNTERKINDLRSKQNTDMKTLQFIEMLNEQTNLVEDLSNKSFVEHEDIQGKISKLKSNQIIAIDPNDNNGNLINEPYKIIKRKVFKFTAFNQFPVSYFLLNL